MKIVDTGNNNEVVGEPLLSKAFNINFKGNNGKVIIEEGNKFINCNLYVHDDAVIKIGKMGYIRGSFLAHNGCEINIGSFMRCNSYLNISTAEKTSVTIGDDCLVAEAQIRTSDMHPIFDKSTGIRINFSSDFVIGKHCWLGQSAYIGKGVTVGEGSVIGAFSVVTKSIGSNVVAVGNPARQVKENIAWEKRL
jgi:acetyltransferase-like isoleucine patch superfamily enzyme